MHANRTRNTAQIVIFAILFLFFLQVLSDFIESIYAFGLLVTAFTIQLASVLLLFTPLLLFLVQKPPSRPWVIGLVWVAMLGRLIEPMLDPSGKLVACGVSVGAFMLLFPILLASRLPKRQKAARLWKSPAFAASLLIAVSMSIFFRAANSSVDLSESGLYQLIGWVLAALAGRLIWSSEVFGSGQDKDLKPPRTPGAPRNSKVSVRLAIERAELSPSTARVVGLSIGLASVMLMVYFGFASPTVIARWTGYSYPAIVAVLVFTLTAFSFLLSTRSFAVWLSRPLILGWNALFVLMLLLTIVPHQIAFPADPAAYPVDAPDVSLLAMLPLLLMLLLSPIIFIDFALYTGQLSDDGPSIRQLGIGFAPAALFMLVMVFFQVFTSIYDYAAPVGPLFRDRFWSVYLLAGLGLALPVLLVSDAGANQSAGVKATRGGSVATIGDAGAEAIRGGGVAAIHELPLRPRLQTWFTPAVVGSLAILSIGAIELTAPRTLPVLASTDQLRVMTYNIQQGFDKVGNKNLQGQLDVILQTAPDVLGLQESDTARVANGNVDAVRFFASHLNMYSYYGPTTTTGTFGIALLSKYPIQNPRTFFMYSTGEQTAAIQALIMVGGKTYNVFVTHLGNDGPIVQLQGVLQRVDGLPNVILMGDFNFNPSTPQYALATQSLADAWLVRWPGGKDVPGLGSDGRIDQIFVSRSTAVVQSEYVVNPESDHPYLYAVVKP